MNDFFEELWSRSCWEKVPGLSATNDFIPGVFPQACGHFVNFFVHDCFGEEGGFPVRGDFVVPAIPGSLIGRLIAQVSIM